MGKPKSRKCPDCGGNRKHFDGCEKYNPRKKPTEVQDPVPEKFGKNRCATCGNPCHSGMCSRCFFDPNVPTPVLTKHEEPVTFTDGRKSIRVCDEGTFFVIEHDGKREVGWKHGEAKSVLRLLTRALALGSKTRR